MKNFMGSVGNIKVKIEFIHCKLLKGEQADFPGQSRHFAYFNYIRFIFCQ